MRAALPKGEEAILSPEHKNWWAPEPVWVNYIKNKISLSVGNLDVIPSLPCLGTVTKPMGYLDKAFEDLRFSAGRQNRTCVRILCGR